MKSVACRYLKLVLCIAVVMTMLCSVPGLAFVSDSACPALVNFTEPGVYYLDPGLVSERTIYGINSSDVTLNGLGLTYSHPTALCPAIAIQGTSLSNIHLTDINADNYPIDLVGFTGGSVTNSQFSNSVVKIGGSNINVLNNLISQNGEFSVSGANLFFDNNNIIQNLEGLAVTGSGLSFSNNGFSQNSHGLVLSGSNIISLNNIYLQNINGISASGDELHFSSDNFVGNDEALICNYCTNADFSNNSWKNNSYDLSFVKSSNITFSDNTLENSDSGFLYRTSENVTIKNNLFSKQKRPVDSTNASAEMSSDFSVHDNAISGCIETGIHLEYTKNLTISHNTVRNCTYGIELFNSRNGTVSRNSITGNRSNTGGSGVNLLNSDGIDIISNNVSIHRNGVWLHGSNNNTIRNNYIFNNSKNGVVLELAANNSVRQNNILNNNDTGFACFFSCYKNSILFNTIRNSTDTSFKVYWSNYTLISNNVIENSQKGLQIQNSKTNVIQNNYVRNHVKYGISLHNSSQNKIYNNSFNNTKNADFWGAPSQVNSWNRTKIPGKNIIGGSYLGGNYWANPSGTGYSQTCSDANKDGFCDVPYVLNIVNSSRNTDYLPLKNISILLPTITVFVPNGGQVWAQGSVNTIAWNYSGTPGPAVRIELMKGPAVNRVINASTSIGTSGSGSYTWTVPFNQVPGTDYRIRVTSTASGVYNDTSNANFTIRAGAPFTVTVPNGGQVWSRNTSRAIAWKYTGNPGSFVKIELLKGMAFNRLIAANISIGSAGAGSRSWLIPLAQTPGSDYRIRVTSLKNAILNDTSNGNFTITP